jgi:hypothetical protein
MNIFQFFDLLNILENINVFKFVFGFLIIEVLWFIIQSYGIIDNIIYVLNIVLFVFKILIGIIGISPFLYILYKFVPKICIAIYTFTTCAYQVVANLRDENFLLFLKNQNKKRLEKRKRRSKIYSKLKSFESLDDAFSFLKKNPVDGVHYNFWYRIFI